MRKTLSSLLIVALSLASAPAAQAVIVIYNSNGGCALCIGSPTACGLLCGTAAVAVNAPDKLAVVANDTVTVGNTVSVSEVSQAPDGQLHGFVTVANDGDTLLEGYFRLDEVTVIDLESGADNPLSTWAGLAQCQ